MNRLSRRSFITSASLAVAAPLVLPAAVLGREGRVSPNERIGMALIGCGGQGRGDMGNLLNYDEVRFLAVCDPVPEHRAEAKKRVTDRYKSVDCAEYADFREVLERPGLDAVLIATPDHWHSTITIAAAKKGIDVYCEKPETLTVREGRRVADAVKKYGIVFSGGSQRVIGDYGDIPRLLWGGAIGEIKEVHVDCGGPPRDCNLPEQPTPDG
ncbi:MAG TPA: gfo/Idh/MocA family oxidoreductase, partial [Planctomycetaceae bacterium]|nr:gfo/Idh/MocA family oxidoreductase [Planctomycetaceae bacterium]